MSNEEIAAFLVADATRHATKNTTGRSITHQSQHTHILEGPAYASATSESSNFLIRHIFNTS
jgi:hypothetical protein